ncbi:DMT family transporter [Dongia mobilis]|jgi:drug/metabolite transporter (DMT)-like permease|uniref:DMT family transporter n=1 Tax=Dongia sp. TaxID=1977262 RepID=UPI0026EA71AC
MTAATGSNAPIEGGILWPSLAMVGSSIFWGSMWYPLRAVEAAGIPAALAGALCYGVPLIPLLPFLFIRHRQLLEGGWRVLLCGGALACCNILFAVAVVMGEVGIIILLFYLSPIWSTILERIFMKTPLTPIRWIGIGLALVGLMVLQGVSGRWPWPSNLAEWMGLGAGLCWAVALLTARMWSHITVLDKSIAQFGCALPVGLLVYVLLGDVAGPAGWPALDILIGAVPWIIGAAFIWVVPAMVLSLWGAGRLSPGRASILMTSEVVVGVGSAVWLAGEDLGWHKIVGGILIVSASLLETWQARREGQDAAEGAKA